MEPKSTSQKKKFWGGNTRKTGILPRFKTSDQIGHNSMGTQKLRCSMGCTWAVVAKWCHFMNISLNSWPNRSIRVFHHSNQNVWLHHCSTPFFKAHLEPLPLLALTSTSNCIHEEVGNYIIICISRYQVFATNISNSDSLWQRFFSCLQASKVINRFFAT